MISRRCAEFNGVIVLTISAEIFRFRVVLTQKKCETTTGPLPRCSGSSSNKMSLLPFQTICTCTGTKVRMSARIPWLKHCRGLASRASHIYTYFQIWGWTKKWQNNSGALTVVQIFKDVVVLCLPRCGGLMWVGGLHMFLRYSPLLNHTLGTEAVRCDNVNPRVHVMPFALGPIIYSRDSCERWEW